jgi:DNA invertase Pin-like site-specific DNA recombinase
LPVAGAATAEILGLACESWIETATNTGMDLRDLNPRDPLPNRIAWAVGQGLEIGVVLSRFSSKLQHSTAAQVRECLQFAARNRIYVPPEYVSIDEATSGRKSRRAGLDRCRQILQQGLAQTLLVFKVSRLFRVAYLGFKFFNEEVVEEGLRGVSVSQGIDTRQDNSWKQLCYLHGIMDEMLVSTIADHVRSGLKDLFLRGYLTGAPTLGYLAAEVPGAPPTNRGLPRTMPQIDPAFAARFRRHVQQHLDGVPLCQGWKSWVRDGGPADRRSRTKVMSYPSYRRMLANPRYTGRFAFGRRRNVWSTKRDYTRQIEQPETDVVVVQSEELRILSDEQFFALQALLAKLRRGPRSPKRRTTLHIWDLVTDCFFCATCRARFYQAGAHGKAMRCKRAGLCPALTSVNRRVAVLAVLDKLTGLTAVNAELVERTICRAQQIDAEGDESLRQELARKNRQLLVQMAKVEDLNDLLGQGSDADRSIVKAKMRAALAGQTEALAEKARLERLLAQACQPITSQQVRAILDDMTALLAGEGASEGREQDVYRAAQLFRLLVGERIIVHLEPRPGRKRGNVRGTFVPAILQAVESRLPIALANSNAVATEVSVWLRPLPRIDQLAERIYSLIDVAGHNYRSAAAVLQSEGHRLNDGAVWQMYRRYYEMIGQPTPDLPYNNGRPRRGRA